MANPDFSSMSDEELDALISGATTETPLGVQPTGEELKRQVVQSYQDTAQGMSPVELGLAGLGSEFNSIGQGLKEKAQMFFASDKDEPALLKQITEDRAERAALDAQLLSNPVAAMGKLSGQVGMAAAAPARIGAQMALEAALSGSKAGTGTPSGFSDELLNSGINSGISTATTGLVGKGLEGVGKVAGVARGDMSAEGLKALKVKEAATRLGLPPTSVGQLYPDSAVGAVERAMPGYGAKTVEQAKALRTALDRPTVLPEGEVPNVGMAYVDELAQAGENRMRLAGDKYRAVDEFVEAKGLGGFTPMYSARAITNVNNPGYDTATNLLERYGFKASATRGATAKELGATPLSFENYHTMRVAANKALSTIERGMANAEAMGAAIPAENAAAAKYLRDFKTALDSDAEAWAKRNASNTEALDKYKEATAYFRDVAAPTVLGNPLARKAMSKTKGFKSGAKGLSAATSNEGTQLVDLLYPTMTRRGQDMTDVLHNLSDVRTTALSPSLAAPRSDWGALRLVPLAGGHPLAVAGTASSRLPGLRALSESETAAKLMGANNSFVGSAPTHLSPLQALQEGGVKGLRARLAPAQGAPKRLGWGAAQIAQDALNERLRRLAAAQGAAKKQ